MFQQRGGGAEAGGGIDGEDEEGGDASQQSLQEAMAVNQLNFFTRTLSTGWFVIVWENIFLIANGR